MIKRAYLQKFLIITFITGISGCQSLGVGLSLDKRYQKAYQRVLTDPNSDNIKTFMKFNQRRGERDMQETNSKTVADTRESDKGLTEYFRSYDNNGFKRARQ